ncbi:hypothetical protein B0H14DRAFT_2987315 [Mycena olivaceomarginata]|nr:hypothetical protein B0H14DRAFT_2987315 [Mycena olivaceomarginata]
MALEICEETFPGVKYPKLEVERGFRFWDVVRGRSFSIHLFLFRSCRASRDFSFGELFICVCACEETLQPTAAPPFWGALLSSVGRRQWWRLIVFRPRCCVRQLWIGEGGNLHISANSCPFFFRLVWVWDDAHLVGSGASGCCGHSVVPLLACRDRVLCYFPLHHSHVRDALGHSGCVGRRFSHICASHVFRARRQ